MRHLCFRGHTHTHASTTACTTASYNIASSTYDLTPSVKPLLVFMMRILLLHCATYIQPTLHKPGIMAHRVRVLRNPAYQTIRMHYANCNTYNADFDGDEINCHLPQNELAVAEANLIAFTNEQYSAPTDGKPLRGLIQDSVDGGVKMCSRDTFLTKEEFQQLIFQALAGLPGLEIAPPNTNIVTPLPVIMKPRELWTGKQ
eukprot:11810-Heterococcus_DN1.PRE.1